MVKRFGVAVRRRTSRVLDGRPVGSPVGGCLVHCGARGLAGQIGGAWDGYSVRTNGVDDLDAASDLRSEQQTGTGDRA